MPYAEELCAPMRAELTGIGVRELRTAQDVDDFMADKSGTALIMVNSVCGCAAGTARPGLAIALKHEHQPDRSATVFAGQDVEATQKARDYFGDLPPTSPSFVLFKNGELVHLTPRHRIEGSAPEQIAAELTAAFDQYCAAPQEVKPEVSGDD